MNKWLPAFLMTLLLTACKSQPTPVADVVDDFDADRYLGKWYEIARMPHTALKRDCKALPLNTV